METFIGPYMGFKVLEWDGMGGDRIVSPYRGSHSWWPKRTVFEADCRKSDSRICTDHKSPDFDCQCGYYGYLEIDDALNCRSLFRGYGRLNFYFVCLVAGWGDMVTCKNGFRSQYMDIVGVHNFPAPYGDKLKTLATDLDIPLLYRNALSDYAHEYGTVLTEETIP
jgi:hypothetical protein